MPYRNNRVLYRRKNSDSREEKMDSDPEDVFDMDAAVEYLEKKIAEGASLSFALGELEREHGQLSERDRRTLSQRVWLLEREKNLTSTEREKRRDAKSWRRKKIVAVIAAICVMAAFYWLIMPKVVGMEIKTDTGETYVINVYGDSECFSKTQEALDLLRRESPGDYYFVGKYMDKLDCVTVGTHAHMVEPCQVQFAYKTLEQAGTAAYAGGLVHEACHCKEYYGMDNSQIPGDHPDWDYDLRMDESEIPDTTATGGSNEFPCLRAEYYTRVKLGIENSTLKEFMDKSTAGMGYWNMPIQYW